MSDETKAQPQADSARNHGFSFNVMTLTVVVLIIFLAGIVWVSAGTLKSSATSGERELRAEMTKTMHKIGVLLKSASQVVPVQTLTGSSKSASASSYLLLLADLDGDAHTGGPGPGGRKGLERVVLHRQGKAGARLVISFFVSGPQSGKTIVLTDLLDTSDPAAFVAGGSRKSGGDQITVRLVLTKGDAELRSDRAFQVGKGVWKEPAAAEAPDSSTTR